MNRNGFLRFIPNLMWILPLGFIIIFWDYTASMVFMLLAAMLLAAILKPAVNALEYFINGRILSVIAVYIILFILIGWGVNTLWPVIYEEAVSIKSYLSPETFSLLRSKSEMLLLGLLPEFTHDHIREFFQGFDTTLNDIWAVAVENIQTTLSHAGSLAIAVGSLLLSFFFVIVFSFFFVLEGNRYKKAFIRMVPNAYFEMTLNILKKVTDTIGAYIRGQLMAATAIGILSILGLLILQAVTPINIPYTFLIGTVAGVANLIPFIGPVMGMIPAIIVYLVTDQTASIQFMHVLFIILTFGCVQLLDNILVSPMIMSGSVGLHPLAIIIVVMTGGTIAGPVGMLLAVPIVTIGKVILEELIWGLKSYRYI